MRTLKTLTTCSPLMCALLRRCCNFSSTSPEKKRTSVTDNFRTRLASGPSFQDFVKKGVSVALGGADPEEQGYLSADLDMGRSRKVYFETYGCQMNVSDTQIAQAILEKKGYQRTAHLSQADVVLLVTCSIREKAEQTIWNRLQQLAAMKRKRLKIQSPMKIGILGCMAERLKTELLEREKLVDVIAGPDSYRDLPRLLTVADGGHQASNVLLSLEETYADIMPVHRAPQSHSAFVSIMRGCDNMCSYCIVPFTRGRERSRPVSSILEEVRMLSDQGVKEVTLLGQNVNSYRDASEEQFCGSDVTKLSRGFNTVYRSKRGGLRFSDLLDRVSRVDPAMRIRFTSPHPKDFPDEESKRSAKDLCGRTDGNVKVIFPKEDAASIHAGDYVLVEILSATSQSLRGRALGHSNLDTRTATSGQLRGYVTSDSTMIKDITG